MADLLEGYAGMKMHGLIRFGKWREILEEPLPRDPELYRVTTAIVLYAKSVASAASGDLPAADGYRRRFTSAVERVPATRLLFNNTCLDILAVAAEMVNGEIAYRKGRYEAAFAHLRTAVEREDGLPYDEPWGWMQPARHALGALLLEQGEVAEAEAVYRADLGFDPRGHPRPPASGERLGPARPARGPAPPGQARRGGADRPPPRTRPRPRGRPRGVLLLLPPAHHGGVKSRPEAAGGRGG